MKTIVSGFEKFRYNNFSTRIITSKDILKDKVDILLGDNEGVKNIDFIMVLKKYSLPKHIY